MPLLQLYNKSRCTSYRPRLCYARRKGYNAGGQYHVVGRGREPQKVRKYLTYSSQTLRMSLQCPHFEYRAVQWWIIYSRSGQGSLGVW